MAIEPLKKIRDSIRSRLMAKLQILLLEVGIKLHLVSILALDMCTKLDY